MMLCAASTCAAGRLTGYVDPDASLGGKHRLPYSPLPSPASLLLITQSPPFAHDPSPDPPQLLISLQLTLPFPCLPLAWAATFARLFGGGKPRKPTTIPNDVPPAKPTAKGGKPSTPPKAQQQKKNPPPPPPPAAPKKKTGWW